MTGTLAILGCGNLGTAILSGILSSIYPPENSEQKENKCNLEPSEFIACVRRRESAERIEGVLGPLSKHVKILQDRNHEAVRRADYIIIACKPYAVEAMLQPAEIKEAFNRKVLISICAGITVSQIRGYLSDTRCHIIRAMPNTASSIHQSMTVIEDSNNNLPGITPPIIDWIFSRIGEVIHLPPSHTDTATALCGSGPAFFALILEAAIDGAVAMGLPRAQATMMAAQSMKGTAGLVLAGEHPAVLKDKISSPGGCTIGGLLVLEEGAVRGGMAKAIREATVVASQLGSGVKNVNGTRH